MIKIHYDRDCIQVLGLQFSIETIKGLSKTERHVIKTWDRFMDATNHQIYDLVRRELLIDEDKNLFYIKALWLNTPTKDTERLTTES